MLLNISAGKLAWLLQYILYMNLQTCWLILVLNDVEFEILLKTCKCREDKQGIGRIFSYTNACQFVYHSQT